MGAEYSASTRCGTFYIRVPHMVNGVDHESARHTNTDSQGYYNRKHSELDIRVNLSIPEPFQSSSVCCPPSIGRAIAHRGKPREFQRELGIHDHSFVSDGGARSAVLTAPTLWDVGSQ